MTSRLALAGAVVAVLLIAVVGPTTYHRGRSSGDGIRVVYQTFSRHPNLRTDLIQDITGARDLFGGRTTYRPLVEEARQLGITYTAPETSAHPPTAFLLVAPVAFFSLLTATRLWAALMLICLLLSIRLVGASWRNAFLLLPVALLWPPISYSLPQLTLVWGLGMAVAWRYRDRVAISSAAIAIASFTKLLPALVLPLAIRRRPRMGIAVFAGMWLVAGALITILNPSTLYRFATIAGGGSGALHRSDNSSLSSIALQHGGLIAAVAIDVILVAIVLPIIRSDDEVMLWCAVVWLSVALLPVLWIYSLVPVSVPALVAFVRGRLVGRAVIGVVAVLTTFADLLGNNGPVLLAFCVLLVGLALATCERHSAPVDHQGVAAPA